MNFTSISHGLLALPLLTSLLSLQACGTQEARENAKLQKKYRSEQVKNLELEGDKEKQKSEIKALEDTVKIQEESIELIRKGADEQTAQLEAAQADLENLKTLNAQLSAKQQELEGKIALKDNEISNLKDQYETLYETRVDVARLDSLEAQIATLSAEREQLTSEASQLKTSLTESSAKILVAEKKLAKSQTLSLQSFLGNPAPVSLFGLESRDLAKIFKLPADANCMLIFDVSPDLKPNRKRTVPGLESYDVSGLQTSYQKVLVCQEGSLVKAHKESGTLYKVNTRNLSNALHTSRESDTCASDLESKSAIFGTEKVQSIDPYMGSIDGIETIDIKHANGMNRLSEGDSVYSLRAGSCAEVLPSPVASPLAKTACRIALGLQSASAETQFGCFTETYRNGPLELIFKPAAQ